MAGESRVQGIEDLKEKLQEIPRQLRLRVLRNALSAGARVVRDEAKRRAPVLSAQNISAPYRKPGTVRDAIRVRTSKAARQAGDVGVFVNVKPARGAVFRTQVGSFGQRRRVQVRASQRGAKSRDDPFYWRFLEFGTRKMSARMFLRPAADRLSESLSVFQREVTRWVAKVNQTGNPKA